MQRLPIPPLTLETALEILQAAEDAWKARDPGKVALLCAPDCVWRAREALFQGRAAIEYFLRDKWAFESRHQIMKELWAYNNNRISVHFECEWQHAGTNQWYRSHSNEHWEFDADGYMTRRDMSANDVPIPVNRPRIGH